MSEFKHINSKQSTRESRGQLIAVIRKLYDKVPPPLCWIAFPLIYCYKLFLQLRLEFWIVTGDELTSRMPLSILYVGNHDTNRSYLLGLALGASFRERTAAEIDPALRLRVDACCSVAVAMR